MFRTVWLAVAVSMLPLWALAQAPATNSTAAGPAVAVSAVEEELGAVLASLERVQTERAALKKKLAKAADDADRKQINADIERLAARATELQRAFGELATGGVSLAEFERKAEAKFDWKRELEEVVRPMLDELKQLTERPRTLERLRSEQSLYQGRIEMADRVIARLDGVSQQIQSPEVAKQLAALQGEWKERREDSASRLSLAHAQLQRLLEPEEDSDAQLIEAMGELLHGRGLNLLLAILAFVAVYGILSLAGRGLARRLAQPTRLTGQVLNKLSILVYRLFVVLASLAAAMWVLYFRGDWLILGLLLLLLIGSLWTLRQSLPQYLNQARTLLNLGSVREGERVIYGGIPWRIADLNIYSALENPLLRGGSLRLTLEQMAQLHSRPWSPGEPWFPTREEDYVILDGDVYGKVLLQTPELVQVEIVGAVTTFSVADFLARNPRNLSVNGFAMPVVFGLDYKHQSEILGEIPEQLRAHFAECVKDQSFEAHVKGTLIEFNEAASSALNVLLVAVMAGEAAADYWAIRRFMQRTALSACNRFGWTVPFDQLTVHAQMLPPPSAPVAGT